MLGVREGCCSGVLRWVYKADVIEVDKAALSTKLAVEAQFRAVAPCLISPRRATGQTRVTIDFEGAYSKEKTTYTL